MLSSPRTKEFIHRIYIFQLHRVPFWTTAKVSMTQEVQRAEVIR